MEAENPILVMTAAGDRDAPVPAPACAPRRVDAADNVPAGMRRV